MRTVRGEMATLDPDLRRTWLFGPGADAIAHDAMLASGADALIVDLEDFTPPERRGEARDLLARFVAGCRERGRLAAVRINALEGDGTADLAAAMATRPDVIAYPMTDRAAQMHALDAAITHWEGALGIAAGSTEILPVCETALGVVDVRAIAAAQPAHPLCAARSRGPRQRSRRRARPRWGRARLCAPALRGRVPRRRHRAGRCALHLRRCRRRGARGGRSCAGSAIGPSRWCGPSTRRR